MDGSGWADSHALTAHTAFIEVDVGKIVGDGNSLELAFLETLSATDAGIGTSLAGDGTFVFVHAADVDMARLRTFLAKFDDAFRASLDASAAGGTLIFIHLCNHGNGIDMDGIKFAGFHAVAIT